MTSTPREIGTLIVVVLKARNLQNKSLIGKQSPYCTVIFNDEKRRTKAIRKGGQHPEWDEEIRFTLFEDIEDLLARTANDVEPPPPPPKDGTAKQSKVVSVKGGKSLQLACYAEDSKDPEFIGDTVVDLGEVLTKGETDEWFTLFNKDKYCGEVYLELTFWSNEKPPEKRSTPQPMKGNKQYGGPGSFMASDTYPGTSEDQWAAQPTSTLRRSGTLAGLDLYTPAYEQASRLGDSRYASTLDQITNDFGQLEVDGVPDHRRQTYPLSHDTVSQRSSGNLYPSFSLPYAPTMYSTDDVDLSASDTPSHISPYQLYEGGNLEPGPQYTDRAPTPSYMSHPTPTMQPSKTFPMMNSQLFYDPGQGSSYVAPQSAPHRHGPRYSLPPTSSGFVPIPSPASSGFVPYSAHTHELTYGVLPSQIPVAFASSGPQLATISSVSYAPQGFPSSVSGPSISYNNQSSSIANSSFGYPSYLQPLSTAPSPAHGIVPPSHSAPLQHPTSLPHTPPPPPPPQLPHPNSQYSTPSPASTNSSRPLPVPGRLSPRASHSPTPSIHGGEAQVGLYGNIPPPPPLPKPPAQNESISVPPPPPPTGRKPTRRASLPMPPVNHVPGPYPGFQPSPVQRPNLPIPPPPPLPETQSPHTAELPYAPSGGAGWNYPPSLQSWS